MDNEEFFYGERVFRGEFHDLLFVRHEVTMNMLLPR